MTAIQRFLLGGLGLAFFVSGSFALGQDVIQEPEFLEIQSEEADETPVLLSIGASTGFPGFNRFGVQTTMQYRFFGMAVKAAPTAAGLYFGGTLRGYVPLGGFVPMYLGVGGGVYGESTEVHLVLGGHVPIAENFRLDLEAGAARVNSFDTSNWLPWVTVGVSYTIPVTPSDFEAGSGSPFAARPGRSGGSGAVCGEPTESSLQSAFQRTLRSLIRNARATYAGSFTDLNYSYDITRLSMDGNSGEVAISYNGSVRIIGGGTESASGSASASFEWTGCSWRRTSVDY